MNKQSYNRTTGIIVFLSLVISLLLFGVAYLIEQGLPGLSPATVIATAATALLLASFSIASEAFLKRRLDGTSRLSDNSLQALDIQCILERSLSRGLFSGLPDDILTFCHAELLVVAYSADNFVEREFDWLEQKLNAGLHIGLLLLHPEYLEQSHQTENRDIKAQIEKTLSYCAKLKKNREKDARLSIRGYRGHFYFVGVFIDRAIIRSDLRVQPGPVSIQTKANYKSQHEGIVLVFRPGSRYSEYYSTSVERLWEESEDLLAK